MTDNVVSFIAKKIEMSNSAITAATSIPNDPLLCRLAEALRVLVQELRHFCAGVDRAMERGATHTEQNKLLLIQRRVLADILSIDKILRVLLLRIEQVRSCHQ